MRYSVHRKSGRAGTSGEWIPRSSRVVAGCLLVLLLLLVSPGLGRAAEDPAPSNAVPTLAGERFALTVDTGVVAHKEGAEEAKKSQKKLLVIPYPLFNSTFGVGLGVGVIAQGYIQPQAMTVGTAIVGSGSYLVFFKELNYLLPWWKRIILEPDGYVAKYSDVKSYSGSSNQNYVGQRAGSNESSRYNYILSDTTDHFVDLVTKFVLPIGQGKDNVLPKIALDERGLFASGDTGGDVWNPLTSGRTYLEVIPFERRQVLTDNNSNTKTVGIDIGLRYDNTDFRGNPSKGSMQRVWFVRDWGALGSTNTYSVVGAEYSKYFSLGPSDRARQRTFAFDIWTVNCPTWEDRTTATGLPSAIHRPPAYKGASLGGLSRLRAYEATRFNDQAGILYTLEYRYALNYNPLKNVTMGGKLDVAWFQIVPFLEVGRVAPAWNLDTLHKSMKVDAGVGIRAMVNQIVVRIDAAGGDEGFGTQMFISHPFPFY